jgi:predicted nucleic acid-binding protein
MPDYFFDTSVLIAYFKREDLQTHTLIERILEGNATAAISAITLAELWAVSEMEDIKIRDERQALVELLEAVAVDREVAEAAGSLRRKYNLQLPDALIAASCQRVGGHFYSKDPHFKRLTDAKVLLGTIYGTNE